MADGSDDGGGVISRYSLQQANLSDVRYVMAEEYPDNEDVDALIERQLLGLDLQVGPGVIPASPSHSKILLLSCFFPACNLCAPG